MRDSTLASSLESLLGAGYQVRYPAMPGEDDPDYEQWKPTMARELDAGQHAVRRAGRVRQAKADANSA